MRGLEPEEKKRLLLSVGTHRGARHLSPVEVAGLFKKSLDSGSTLQELADSVHFKSATMVSRFLRLLELQPTVRHLVDWGQSGSTLSFTSAYEMARLPPVDHEDAARAILQYKMSGAETRQLVQLRLRSRRPIDECITETIGMRPEVVRQYVFIGSVTNPITRRQIEAMSQADRDTLVQSAIGAAYPSARASGARLGPERFTIVGGDDLADGLSDDFEALINAELDQATTQ